MYDGQALLEMWRIDALSIWQHHVEVFDDLYYRCKNRYIQCNTHICLLFFLCKWDLKGLLQHGNLFIQKNEYHEISIICTLKVNDKLSVISYFDILIWGSSPLTWFIGYRISGRLFLLTENMNQSDEICIIEILYVSHWKEFWDCTLHGGLRQITFHLRLVKRLWNYCIYETCRSTPTQCMCVWVSNFFLLLRYLHSFGFIWFKLTDGDDYLFNISVVRTFVQDGCFFFLLGYECDRMGRSWSCRCRAPIHLLCLRL